jgi:hypothetical protein
MLLAEFKEYLAYGELSQLFIGDKLLNATQFPRIISAINLGLIELYKRFPIKVKELNILTNENRTEYVIHSSKAVSNMPNGSNPLDYYVIDSLGNPFKDDLLKIDIVFKDSEELPLNDELQENSIFTTSHNVIKYPNPIAGSLLLQYRGAAMPLAPCATELDYLDIPPQFVEALVLYVAYRTFAAINMNSAEAVNYYAKFEAACALLNQQGLWHKATSTNMRLVEGGWV